MDDVNTQILNMIMDAEIRAVRIGEIKNGNNSDPINSISVDSEMAGYLAGQALSINGHKNAIVMKWFNSKFMDKVIKGLNGAAIQFGLNISIIESTIYDQSVAKQIISIPNATAVVSVGDNHSCKLIADLQPNGTRVPDDISIVSVGGIPRSMLIEPNIARINTGSREVGAEAVKLLLSNNNTPIHKVTKVFFENGRTLKNLFKERARGGGSIFMSTHTLAVAEELCDRIAIIQEGEIIAEGTLQELRIRAGMGDDEAARLEEVFLKLTTDEEMIDIVEALRR